MTYEEWEAQQQEIAFYHEHGQPHPTEGVPRPTEIDTGDFVTIGKSGQVIWVVDVILADGTARVRNTSATRGSVKVVPIGQLHKFGGSE